MMKRVGLWATLVALVVQMSAVTAAPSKPAMEWDLQLETLQAVEPKLKSKDRKLYDKVEPHLQGQRRLAIEAILAAPAQERSPVFDFYLGNLLMAEGRPEEALAALELCVEKFPRFLKAHRSLASVLAHMGRLGESREHVLKAIALGAADELLYGLLAHSYFEEAQYSSALQAYRMAGMYSGGSLRYRKGELFCLNQLGEYKQVVSLCEALLKDSPREKQYWSMHANAHMALGQPLAAMVSLEVMRELGFADDSSLLLLARLAFNQSLFGTAADSFVEALSLGCEPQQLIQPFRVLVSMGEVDAAQKLFDACRSQRHREALKANEDWRMAEMEFEFLRGQSELALAGLRSIVERWPLNGSAQIRLAKHHLSKGELDEAKLVFEIAAGLEEVQVDAWYELGRLAYGDGDVQQALKWLNLVDEQRPSLALKSVLARLQKQIQL